MKATFDVKKFSQATKWVCDGLPRGNYTVRMEVVNEHKVVLSSVSVSAEKSIELEGEISGSKSGTSFDIFAESLSSLIGQITSDEVNLSYTSKDKTGMYASVGRSIKLPLIANTSRKPRGVKNMKHIGVLSSADFFDAVNCLIGIPNKNLEDQRYGAIDFDSHDGKLTLMAYDVSVLSTRTIVYDNGPDDDDSEMRCLFYADDVKDLLTAAKDSSQLDIYNSNSAVTFVFNNSMTARVNKMHETPFDYSIAVLDRKDDDTEWFIVDVKELLERLKKLIAWNNDKAVLDINKETGVLTIHSSSNDWNDEMPVGEYKLSKDCSIVYTCDILRKTLEAIDTDMAKARFRRPEEIGPGIERAVVWDMLKADGSKDEYSYLISPPAADAWTSSIPSWSTDSFDDNSSNDDDTTSEIDDDEEDSF